MTSIGERIKQQRTELGMSQADLASAAGVSQGSIGNAESGLRKRPRDLVSIAAALGVLPSWLESGKGIKEDLTAQKTLAPYAGASVKLTKGAPVKAHEVSPPYWNDHPLIEWEDLLNATLPDVFFVVAPDDAMAWPFHRGAKIEVSRGVQARAKDVVLIVDGAGNHFIRQMHEKRPGHWTAVATGGGYDALDSIADKLFIVGVVTGAQWGSG